MNIPAAENIYTTKYADFKGVDFTSQICSPYRFPRAKNFVISDMVEKRPGYECLKKFEGKINGFYYVSDEDYYLVHVEDKLYSLSNFLEEPTLLLSEINNSKSNGFYANGYYYILTGADYIQAKKDEAKVINEKTYNKYYEITSNISMRGFEYGTEPPYSFQPDDLMPCNYKGFTNKDNTWKPTNSYIGTVDIVVDNQDSYTLSTLYANFEKVNNRNLLNKFAVVEYPGYFNMNDMNYSYSVYRGFLLPPDALPDTVVIIELSGGKYYGATSWRGSVKDGKFAYFKTYGSATASYWNQPFKVYYQVKDVEDSKIYTCKHSTYLQYGNGVYHFFTGNDSFPNRDWQSALNDPTYIPSDNYTIYGKEDQVLGYGQYGENIAVFKKGNVDNNIYIRSAMDTENLGVVFPVSVGVGGAIGGISSYTINNLNGETLFLTKEGVYALTSLSLTNMKVTRNRSYYVDGKLLKEPDLENAISCVWKNKYILCVNSNCYILDAGQPLSYRDGSNNDYSYECLFWDNIPATSFLSVDNVLYFGTEDGRLCRLTEGVYSDDGEDIDTVIATKLDDDGNYMAWKKMKKKGTGLLVKPYLKSSFDISFMYDNYEDTFVKTAYADIFNFDDIDFDRFTFETSENPRIIPFLKKSKKYKSMQIVIRSNNKEPFGFMSILKRYTFNNYVKRS